MRYAPRQAVIVVAMPLMSLKSGISGDEQTYHRLGTVEFEVEGQPAQLAVYQSTDHEGLFVPFRDATSGEETYGAGRYLEPEALGDELKQGQTRQNDPAKHP